MPYVDLAFRLTGNKVPVDHGYALYSVMSRVLPEIQARKILTRLWMKKKIIQARSERDGGKLSYT
jgi:hypothetical protein